MRVLLLYLGWVQPPQNHYIDYPCSSHLVNNYIMEYITIGRYGPIVHKYEQSECWCQSKYCGTKYKQSQLKYTSSGAAM